MNSPPGPLADIRIGTSGYDYPEWERVLYSKGIGRKEYLGAYSEVFGTLELNFSYYGMPKPGNIRELMARARRPIDFAIKANQALTHKIDPATWKDSVVEFAKGIAPLHESGRLCAVLRISLFLPLSRRGAALPRQGAQGALRLSPRRGVPERPMVQRQGHRRAQGAAGRALLGGPAAPRGASALSDLVTSETACTVRSTAATRRPGGTGTRGPDTSTSTPRTSSTPGSRASRP